MHHVCVRADVKNGVSFLDRPYYYLVFYYGCLPWDLGRGYSVGRSPLHTLGNSSCHDMIYGRRTRRRGGEEAEAAAAGIEKVWQCLPKRAS